MQDLNTNNSSSLSSSPSTSSSSSSSSPSSPPPPPSTTTAKIIASKTYIDHVYSFSGQSYDSSTESTLNALNELSASDRLCLQSRRVANRDVRILLPNKDSRHEIHNYETFLYNFNKLALACYLKVLRASGRLWSAHDIDQDQDSSTNYSNILVANLNRDEERHLRSTLDDDEFVKTYLDLVVNAHNQIANKLYMLLNTNMSSTRVHFKAFEAHKVDFGSKKASDTHLFRTFRIIGLRKQRQKSPRRRGGVNNYNRYHHSSQFRTAGSNGHPKGVANFLLQNDFNEVVDIRGAFDIKQFHNRTGYDCFIECEFSYFRIYHHMCTHAHFNWNSNEFNTARGFYHQLQQQQQQQQQYQSSYYQQQHSNRHRSNKEENTNNNNHNHNRASSNNRRKAERLIANHVHHYHPSSQQQPHHHHHQTNNNVTFTNNLSQIFPNPIQISNPNQTTSMRIITTSSNNHTNHNNNNNNNATCNLNDFFFGGAAQYHNINNNNTGRNNLYKSSFYFTKSRDDSN